MLSFDVSIQKWPLDVEGIAGDGSAVRTVSFDIARPEENWFFSLRIHRGGIEFNEQCEKMHANGGVTVDAQEFPDSFPDTTWLDAVVESALKNAEKISWEGGTAGR